VCNDTFKLFCEDGMTHGVFFSSVLKIQILVNIELLESIFA
jgi:hypothetical protein